MNRHYDIVKFARHIFKHVDAIKAFDEKKRFQEGTVFRELIYE